LGLGNPGRRYAGTRHNAGFMLVSELADAWAVRIRKRRYASKVGGADRPQGKVLLALPQTNMNASGIAARAIVDEAGIPPRRMVVAFDDFDLPLGEIRIRKGGGAGTHKGMASIIRELGTSEVPRIRLGIGPLPEGEDPVKFVLSPLRERELRILRPALQRAEEALEMILGGEIETAMNRFNVRSAGNRGQ
jgi:PTH1 family peptidyl-tRNA hydrolase